MIDIQFWALIVAVLTAVGGLLVAVFTMGRFTGRVERGLLAVGESVAGLESKVDATAVSSAAAHAELREALMAHLQASIPRVAQGD